MSMSGNAWEASRWFRTAQSDLAAATGLMELGHFAQACFLFQQAAEKAAKALHFAIDTSPWGHSVARLLTDARDSLAPDQDQAAALLKDANALDRFYVPTRYPNGLPDFIPSEVYRQEDAAQAQEAARRILAAIHARLTTAHGLNLPS